MANEMIGMFGQSPEMTQMGINQQDDAQAMQLAQLGPWEALGYGMASGGRKVGNAVGGMLGGTDPRMEEANKNKQVQQAAIEEARMQGIDPGRDQEKFMQIVTQKFSDAGMTDKAMQVQNILQSMKAQQAEIAYKTAKARAEDKKATMESSPWAKADPLRATAESKAIYARTGNIADLQPIPPSPINEFVTGTGGEVYVGDARTGKLTKGLVEGQPIIKPEYSVPLQTALAKGKQAGKILGEAETQAAVDLPQKLATGQEALNQLDELLKHPGFSTTVGATLLPGARFVPGTDASDFQTRLKQVEGGAFLEAYKTLKGGGQITEVEGKKATDAIAAMNISQSEKEFRTAATKYIGVIKGGMERAKRGITVAPPNVVAPTAPSNTPVGTTPVTLSTKEDVRDAVNSGAISRDQGRAILLDMKNKGVY